jgi:hypothetical protein
MEEIFFFLLFLFFFLIFTYELVQFDLCSDHNSMEQVFILFLFFFRFVFGCHVHIEGDSFLKISAKKKIQTNSPNVAIKLCQYGNCFLLFLLENWRFFLLFFIKEGIIDRIFPSF